jgi:hypothetical protein
VSVTDPIPPRVDIPPRGTNTKVVATLVVVCTFLVGALVGAVAMRFWSLRHPGPPRFVAHAMTERIVHRLDRDLDLIPVQHEQVERIVKQHATRIEGMFDAVHPLVRKEIEATNVEIDRVLTPLQREKFAKLRMKMQSRRRPL